jgi:predicted ATPase/DNA-binding SARP family transcriptional activator
VIEVNLLGALEVRVDGRPVEVRSAKQRALVAALALARGAPCSVDALVEALWGEDDPPADPRASLQTYVSRLRTGIGDGAVAHGPAGYRLELDGGTTDLDEVTDLLARARAAPDATARATLLDRARARWRGDALAELAGLPAFQPEAARLAELRRVVIDDLHDALLASGEVEAALPGLEQAAAGEPLRERTQLLLVRALALAGRSAEALRAADRYRRRLVDETGLDPGPELARLERAVLDGALARSGPPTSTGATPEPLARRAPEPGTPVPEGTGGPRDARALPRSGRFVGRAQELADLERYLREERLVTVVGPGGVGKTRLVAEALAASQPGDAIVVELAGARHGEVAATIAAVAGVVTADAELPEAVAAFLATEPRLLVLDGAEHLVEEVRALLGRVLAADGRSHALVTSRVRLGLPAEQVLPVEPLPVPVAVAGAATPPGEAPEELTDAEALFVDRLRRADPRAGHRGGSDPLVAQICRRLDGLPLALELAAARGAALGLAGLHDRLDQALDLLTATTGSQRLSLRDVVAWSDHLLEPAEARALRALSIFEAGFTLDAAEAVVGAVTGDPGLAIARLVDSSLLLVEHRDGHVRYRLLDSVRRYAAEHASEVAELDAAERSHTDLYAGLLARTAASIPGPHEAGALAEARDHHADLRSALRRALRAGDAARLATLSLAAARVVLYHPDPGLSAWLLAAPGALDAAAEDAVVAPVLAGASRASWQAGRTSEAVELATRALGGAGADPTAQEVARHSLGVANLYEGRHDEAIDRWRHVLDDAASSAPACCDALAGIALAHAYAGRASDARRARDALEGAVEALGSDTYLAMAAYVAGEVALAFATDGDGSHDGADVGAAIACFERSIALAGPSDARFVAALSGTALSAALVRSGRWTAASTRLAELLELLRRGATWPQLWTAVRLVAEAVADRDPGAARALLDAADRDPAAPAVVGTDATRLTELRARLPGPAPSGPPTASREQVLALALSVLA